MRDEQIDQLLDALNSIDDTLMQIGNTLSSLVSVQEGQYGR